jgi:hypothetical protein
MEIETKHQVFPTEKALEILGKARSNALQNCEFRNLYGKCDKPLDVGLIPSEIAEKICL